MTVQLPLEQREATLLDEVLARFLHELQEELVRTKDRDFRSDLLQRMNALETVHRRLGTLIPKS
jgi:hypothetical protein